MKYKILVLTIERNIHRYDKLIKNLTDQNLINGIDFQLFFGIDYKNTSKTILNMICSNLGNYCPYATLSCAVSHILLWNYIRLSSLDYAIILEDDTYINVDKYINIREDVEYLVQKGIVYLYNDIHTNLFNTKIVLSMGCYCISKQIATILYSYFIKNKITYHIDFQLNYVLKNLNINQFVYKNNSNELTYQINGNNSSMSIKHSNIFLNIIKDTYTHRILTTPIVRFGDLEFDTYVALLIVLSVFITIISHNYAITLTILLFLIYQVVDLLI